MSRFAVGVAGADWWWDWGGGEGMGPVKEALGVVEPLVHAGAAVGPLRQLEELGAVCQPPRPPQQLDELHLRGGRGLGRGGAGWWNTDTGEGGIPPGKKFKNGTEGDKKIKNRTPYHGGKKYFVQSLSETALGT